MNPSTLILKVKRYNPEKNPPCWEETYEVEGKKGMTLLEVLLRVQDEQDGTLSFRYSCRGAVCGSCAMKVNGELVLACRTQIDRLSGKVVVWRWVGWCATVAKVPELVAKIERSSGAGQSPYLIPKAVPQDHPKARSSQREGVLLRALQVLTALVLWARAQIAPPSNPSPLSFFLGERFRTFRRLEHLVPRRLSPPSPVSGRGPPALKGGHGIRRRD